MKSLNEYILLESSGSFLKELSKFSGLREEKIAEFLKRTEIDPHDLLQLLGQKKLKPLDFTMAVMDKPGNDLELYIIKHLD